MSTKKATKATADAKATPCDCEEVKTAKKPSAKKAATPAAKTSRVTFSVSAEPGSKVFLAGSFNNWDPLAKELLDKKDAGVFSGVLMLPKGQHEYKFVINGTWCADPECPDWVQNSMGTLNSVKIVD